MLECRHRFPGADHLLHLVCCRVRVAGNAFKYFSFRPKPVFVGAPICFAALFIEFVGPSTYLFFEVGPRILST